MQNSIEKFTFLDFGPKYLFWACLVQKFKFVCSGKNLLPRLIWICRTQCQCSLHLFSSHFWASLVQKMKIVSFSWNLIHSLTQIWRTQWWCSLFLFFNETLFYGKFADGKSIKIVCWSWNLESRLILLCKIRWWCSFFLF